MGSASIVNVRICALIERLLSIHAVVLDHEVSVMCGRVDRARYST